MEKNLCIQFVPYVTIKRLSKVITMIHGSFFKKTALLKLTHTILPAHTISPSSKQVSKYYTMFFHASTHVHFLYQCPLFKLHQCYNKFCVCYLIVSVLLGEKIHYIIENRIVMTFLPSVSVVERIIYLPIRV